MGKRRSSYIGRGVEVAIYELRGADRWICAVGDAACGAKPLFQGIECLGLSGVIVHEFRQRLDPGPVGHLVPKCVEPTSRMPVHSDGEQPATYKVAQCATRIHSEQYADDIQRHEGFVIYGFQIKYINP